MVSIENQTEKAFRDFRQGLLDEVKGKAFEDRMNSNGVCSNNDTRQ